MKRWRELSKATAAAASMALLAVGCGNAGAPSASEVSNAQAVDARLAALDTSIWGSNLERGAGAYLGHVAINAPIEKCMEGLGFPYNAPYVDGYSTITDPGGADGTWAQPLMNSATSANVRASAEVAAETDRLMRAPEKGSVKASDEYSKALRECGEPGDYGDAASPRASLELSSDLAKVVGGISSEYGTDDAYNECMKAAGFDVTSDDEVGYEGMVALIRNSSPPPDDILNGGADANAKWENYLEFEQAVLTADEDCRLDRHVDAMAEIDIALDKFEQDHADEIAAIRADWQSIVKQAKAAGWDDSSYR